jgi:hypothetical protein
MKKNQPFDSRSHSVAGRAAMDFYLKDDLNSLASKLIENYNPDRFDATALRFFIQKGAPVITLFAVDKLKQEQNNYPKDKLPVKKFKLNLAFDDFLRHIRRFDLTVTNDAYDINDMLLINK